MITINFIYEYGLNLEIRIQYNILHKIDSSYCTARLVNWYINVLVKLIKQFFLNPNRINEFMGRGGP
jgi:hypothetical protein